VCRRENGDGLRLFKLVVTGVGRVGQCGCWLGSSAAMGVELGLGGFAVEDPEMPWAKRAQVYAGASLDSHSCWFSLGVCDPAGRVG